MLIRANFNGILNCFKTSSGSSHFSFRIIVSHFPSQIPPKVSENYCCYQVHFQNKHLNITNTPWCRGLLWCKMIQSFIRFFSRWSDIIKQARISLREQDCEAPGCHRQLTLGNWKKLVFSSFKCWAPRILWLGTFWAPYNFS